MNFGQWLGVICLTIALIILWQIRELLLLVFAAVVLATALNSLVRRLQKSGMRRGFAVLMTLSMTLFLGVLFVGLIVPPFVSQFIELVKILPSAVIEILARLENLMLQRPSWFPEIQLPSTSDLTQQLQPVAQDVLQELFAFFSNSLNALLKLLLVIILTLMMLANPEAYRTAFIRLFPSFYRMRADEIMLKCEVALGNWLAGLLISSSIVAALSGVGLWILQIRFVLAHALLAGLLNFIPNIGPTLSVGFPLTVALLDAPWKAIAVLILYFFIQQIEGYLLTPTVMAQQVSLLPALTLIAQIFFASFFGILGLLLALPLAVVAKTWIEEALMKDILDRWHKQPTHPFLEQLPSIDPPQLPAASAASDQSAPAEPQDQFPAIDPKSGEEEPNDKKGDDAVRNTN